MSQWHCAIGDKKYGPIDQATVNEWILQNRIQSTDLVWKEGMAEWAPISTVPEFAASFANNLNVSPVPAPLHCRDLQPGSERDLK